MEDVTDFSTRTGDDYIKAQTLWRDFCQSQHDPEDAYETYDGKYPQFQPEAFRSDDRDKERRWRYQNAKNLIWGKKRNKVRVGGDVGRLRVLAGEPLRQTVLPFEAVTKLRPLRFDPFSQFATEQMQYVESVLQEILPYPCWAVVHMAKITGLHVHVLHGKSVRCPGATCEVIPDEELLKRLMYFLKRPVFDRETAVAYIMVRQACKSDKFANPIPGSVRRGVATRHFGVGLREKVTLNQIEEIFGVCPGDSDTYLQSVDKPTSDTYPVLASLSQPYRKDPVTRICWRWQNERFSIRPIIYPAWNDTTRLGQQWPITAAGPELAAHHSERHHHW